MLGGSLLALPFSLILANQNLAYPYLFGGLLRVLLALVLVLWMPETGFKRISKEQRQGWLGTLSTARKGLQHFQGNPVLRSYMLIGLLLGLYSEGWDRLSDFHLLNQFDFPDLFGLPMGSVQWFVFLSGCAQVLGIAVTSIARRKALQSARISLTWALQGLYAAMLVSMAMFA